MLRISILIFILLSPYIIYSQTYTLDWNNKKHHVLASALFWSAIHGYDMLRKSEILDEYKDIDPKRLSSLDRRSLSRKSDRADRMSDISLYASIVAPFAITAFSNKKTTQAWDIVLMSVHGYLIENGLNQLVKIMSERPRPYIYQQGEAALNTTLSKNSVKSFYSGHASSSAYFAFLGARIFADLHPESSYKPVVWGLAASITGLTGYLRYRAGKHFYSDIITGWVVGGTLGILIPQMYQSKTVSVDMTSSGLSITWRI